MANRLKAYCKRTILTAARDYSTTSRRTEDSTKAAFYDAMQGANTGWWSDLIYTAPALDMASRHRKDIRDAVREFLAETGASAGEFANREQEFTWGDVIAATAERRTWDDYTGSNGAARESEAMALLWGLQFAVEFYAGELARDLAPGL